MIGLQPLYEFIDLCLWTGAVAGERPASAILVAPAGGGKSSALEKMQCDSAPFVTDLTSREISGILKDHPAATHILLSDMMAIFAHRKSVTTLVCAMLSNLTGDSLKNDAFSGNRVSAKMMGLITAVPTPDFARRQVQAHMKTAGFATRFMVLRYEYSFETQLAIHDYIKSDKYARPNGNHVKPAIPAQKEYIEIPAGLADKIHILSATIKGEDDVIGTRPHHHLRALIKARARRDGRTAATEDDVLAVQAYAEFFSPRGKIL